MKSLIVALALSLTSSAFARQYIQCSTLGDSSDVAVVNFQTLNNGTVFLSSGMENSDADRLLLNIEFEKIENGHHVFKIVSDNGVGNVTLPSSIIGKSSNSFAVDVSFSGYGMSYSCFSRLYND